MLHSVVDPPLVLLWYIVTFKDSATDTWFFGIYCVSLEEVTVQNFSAFPYRITYFKSFFKYCDKLLQWNKQTVVKHYRSVLHNDFLIIIMKWLHRYLNDTEILIVFKQTELSRCCSKWIIHKFQLLQCSCRWRVFRSLFKGTLMQIWKSGNIFVFTWK